MVDHRDTIGSGEVYGKRNLQNFHRNLFQRGAKINIKPDEEGVFLEKARTAGLAWVLTKGGAGGKITVPLSRLEDLNRPVVEEVKA